MDLFPELFVDDAVGPADPRKHVLANKFHAGNGADGEHYWRTPPDLMARLNARYRFDFDPCPWPLPEGFDGLTCEWGQRNYVNPPFGSVLVFKSKTCAHETASKKSATCTHCGEVGKKKGPTAWIRKAMLEATKGKFSLVVYPIDKWIFLAVPQIVNLGDVRWISTETGRPGKGTGRHIAALPFGPHPNENSNVRRV